MSETKAPDQDPELIGKDRVLRMLGVGADTLYDYIRNADFPAPLVLKEGKNTARRWDRHEVLAWINSRRRSLDPAPKKAGGLKRKVLKV